MVNLSTLISSGIQIGGSSGSDLPVSGSIPGPSTNIQRLFAQKRAGKTFLRGQGDIGKPLSAHPSFYETSQQLWSPGTASTISVFGGPSLTAINSGTAAAISHPLVSGASNIDAMRKTLFSTGSTATGTAGIRESLGNTMRGNAPNRGGWFQFARFGIDAYEADIRIILGLTSTAGALSADPSAFTDMAGLIKDSADTTWQFAHCSVTGPATKFNTGVVINATDILDFYSYCLPNGNEIYFELRNALTDSLLSSYVANTALPTSDERLIQRVGIMSVSTTTSKRLALNKMYLETEL